MNTQAPRRPYPTLWPLAVFAALAMPAPAAPTPAKRPYSTLHRHTQADTDFARAFFALALTRKGSSAPYLATMQRSLEHGATHVNLKGRGSTTPLLLAAVHNVYPLARLLIAKGADVRAKDKDGWTPLHGAAIGDGAQVAALLLTKGANKNARDHHGWTPLHLSAFHNAQKVAALLLAKGADADAKDTLGATPLHWAAEKNAVEVAASLLAHGADVNAKSDSGRTPFHWAAEENAKKVAALLLAKGADVNAKDNNGRTPLDHADAYKAAAVAALLRASGGAPSAARRAKFLPIRQSCRTRPQAGRRHRGSRYARARAGLLLRPQPVAAIAALHHHLPCAAVDIARGLGQTLLAVVGVGEHLTPVGIGGAVVFVRQVVSVRCEVSNTKLKRATFCGRGL